MYELGRVKAGVRGRQCLTTIERQKCVLVGESVCACILDKDRLL